MASLGGLPPGGAARLVRRDLRANSHAPILSVCLSVSLSHAREGDGGAGSMAVSA